MANATEGGNSFADKITAILARSFPNSRKAKLFYWGGKDGLAVAAEKLFAQHSHCHIELHGQQIKMSGKLKSDD